ncbi:hypothetical protein [Burkholderia vietnamiensis]|uniref:hypothetical protein n=1 Tax=Burkholderia vietnamiensis TaxID=60552 RepID=UPI001CF3B47F|nr:hypothetical protein [Burkholderia vietnamiensis]MCA8285402.1 hypothetical protein [Burkholderia vietnamiensis]
MTKKPLYTAILPIYHRAIEEKMVSDKISKTQIIEEALDKYLNISQIKTPIEKVENNLGILANHQNVLSENIDEANKKIEECHKMISAIYNGLVKRNQ